MTEHDHEAIESPDSETEDTQAAPFERPRRRIAKKKKSETTMGSISLVTAVIADLLLLPFIFVSIREAQAEPPDGVVEGFLSLGQGLIQVGVGLFSIVPMIGAFVAIVMGIGALADPKEDRELGAYAVVLGAAPLVALYFLLR